MIIFKPWYNCHNRRYSRVTTNLKFEIYLSLNKISNIWNLGFAGYGVDPGKSIMQLIKNSNIKNNYSSLEEGIRDIDNFINRLNKLKGFM